MAQGFPVLGTESDDKLILHEAPVESQEIILHTELASELYNVFYYREANDNAGNENNEEVYDGEESSTNDLHEFGDKDSAFCGIQDIKYLPESVCSVSESISPVTHIEIIKSGSRRVTGANRVVPFLTNALKNGKLAVAEIKLADVYKTFLSDLGSSDSNNVCMICQEVLLSCTELEHHIRYVHTVDITADQCFVCRKKYVFQDQLKIHLSQTHSINCPDLICKICFMEFNTTIEQKAHERKHDESHNCTTCNKKFSSEYLYQKHLNQHDHQVKPNECEKCNKRFKNEILFNIHKKHHVNVLCTSCKIHFPNDTALLLHMKEHKTDDIMKFLKNAENMDKEESELEEMLTSYTKLTQKAKINTHKDLESEEQNNLILDCVNAMVSAVAQSSDDNVRNEKGPECRLCGKHFATDKELLNHRKQFHLRNRTCPFCGKRNRSVSQTWRHIHSHLKSKVNVSKLSDDSSEALLPHSGYCNDNSEVSSCSKIKQVQKNIRLYNCNICSRKFLYPGSRDNHVLQHSRDKCDSWRCTVCGCVFSNLELLLAHSSAHEPSRNCQICDKRFLSQSSLQLHIKSHFDGSEKKVFKCNMCPIVCPTFTGLQAHRRCHTGERPYTCGQCHRRFKRRQAVKKHIQVVHNSGSLQYHTCSHCPRTFNSSGNLIRHYLRVHCQVRRFICGVCGSRFSQNQDLRRHFKVSHDIEMPNINGSDRKALREIYVIPDIGDLSETNPHALKIKAIVAEEKAKFSRLSELLISKAVNEEASSIKSALQLIDNFPQEGDEQDIDNLQTVDKEATTTDQEGSSSSECVEKEAFSREQCDTTNSVTNPKNNCDEKLYLCEYCNKNVPDENEYMEHIANRSKFCNVCKFCGSIFCDKLLLEEHFGSAHKTLQFSNSIAEMDREENYMKHIQSVDDAEVVSTLTNYSQEFQENSHDEQRNITMTSLGKQGVLVSSNIITDTSSLTTSDNVGSNLTSEQSAPLANNIESNNVATLHVNGIVFQNVIIQQTPTVIQPVPLCFQNQELVHSTSPMAPVITFHSSPVAPVNNHTSYFNASDVHSMNVSDYIGSAGKITALESTPERVSQYTSSSQIEISGDNEGMKKHANEIEENVNIYQDTEQRNAAEKSGNSDQDKKFSCDDSKKVKCKYCEDKFFNASSLKRHLKTHGEKQYVCPDCGKQFSERYNLKAHMMIHTGERPYLCEDCGKPLRYKKDVMDHKRMHLGEKRFECEECGRKFIRQRELIRHKVIHTGEKKHKCPICGKTFGRLDQLKHAHLPIHSDSQPMHTCKLCNKSFKMKSRLKQHEILHLGLKQYKCELCNKTFALDAYLKAHMLCHKKRRNYIQCPKCPRQFANEATLQVHESTFHARLKKASKECKKIDEETCVDEEDVIKIKNMNTESGLGADIEIHDVDLSILETNDCNAVIYLQMAPEDLKFPLGGIDN